nr:DUF3265 domain-containing protein [Vibrio sp. gvc]
MSTTYITNASRGTVNARYFSNALAFVINLLCVKLDCCVASPLGGR